MAADSPTKVPVRGVFWLPPDSTKTIAGVLDADRMILELEGSFEDLPAAMDPGDVNYPLVHGSTRDGLVTLYDCEVAGRSMRFPGYVRHDLRAKLVIAGDLLDPDETFDEMDVRTDHLADWHRRSGLNLTINDPKSEEKWRLTYRWPEESTAHLSDGAKVTLAFSHSIPNALGRFEAEEISCLRVNTSSAITERELFAKYGGPLRDLVTFATLAPAVLSSVIVRSDRRAHALPNGELHKPDLVVARRWVQPAEHQVVKGTVFPSDQLLLPEDHPGGFAEIVSAWFELYPRAKEALDIYLGAEYRPNYWFPSRVATIAQALEAFHRLTLPTPEPEPEETQRRADVIAACPVEHREWLTDILEIASAPTLRNRLRDLVKRVQPVTDPVFRTPAKFINDLVDARNLHSHPGDRSKAVGTDLERLYWVYVQAKWLLRANVLLDLGLPEASLRAALTRNTEFERLQVRERPKPKPKDAPDPPE